MSFCMQTSQTPYNIQSLKILAEWSLDIMEPEGAKQLEGFF